MLLYFILLLTCVNSAILTPKQINHTTSILNHIIKTHAKHLEYPLVRTEIFCRCNIDRCDDELVHIGGEAVRGMCRARGGMCRQAIKADVNGHVEHAVLDCVGPEYLHPPGRPFICETAKNDKSVDYVICCNDGSFCNDLDVPIGKPKSLADAEEKSKKSSNWPWFVVLLIVVAIVFSALGLIFGIFWFNSPVSKQVMRNALRRNENFLSFMFTNSALNRLLDDLEAQNEQDNNTKILARRTIARQIELKHAIARGRFGEVWVGDWRGEKVAVKIFASRDEKSWKLETDIYSSTMLRHNNILRWIASDNKDTGTLTQLWLITEYLPNGSLADYLENNVLTISEGIQYIRSIAHGLAYLHTEVPGMNSNSQCYKPRIAHLDIKSRNILVRNDMTCAIADLGLAVRDVAGIVDMPDSGRGGTVRYLSPEYLSDTILLSRFDSFINMDIYALSLVIWEITRRMDTDCGKKPPSAQVPYFEFVDREPSVDEMKKCVCVDKNRPTSLTEWEDNKITRELQRIMKESWTEHASSRLTALNIRCTLDKLVEQENLKIMT